MKVRASLVLCAMLLATRSLDAQPLGAPFRVNSRQTGEQVNPAAAFDGQGGAIVVWIDNGNANALEAQRYGPGFAPVGGEFKVNGAVTPSVAYAPAVSAGASGSFVVVWAGFGPVDKEI